MSTERKFEQLHVYARPPGDVHVVCRPKISGRLYTKKYSLAEYVKLLSDLREPLQLRSKQYMYPNMTVPKDGIMVGHAAHINPQKLVVDGEDVYVYSECTYSTNANDVVIDSIMMFDRMRPATGLTARHRYLRMHLARWFDRVSIMHTGRWVNVER